MESFNSFRAQNRQLSANITVGSLTPETGEVYDSFYNPLTRRLVLVTPDGIDYSRGLNENIENRKKLLFDKGILSNPYNFTDL